jgi:hypothetical protein
MKAEIRGKISSSGSNLHDRLEDQLTGDVFGACRYVRPELLLWPLLDQPYFRTTSNRLCLKQPRLSGDIHFWPWLDEAEPDVLIDIEETNVLEQGKADELSRDNDYLSRFLGVEY